MWPVSWGDGKGEVDGSAESPVERGTQLATALLQCRMSDAIDSMRPPQLHLEGEDELSPSQHAVRPQLHQNLPKAKSGQYTEMHPASSTSGGEYPLARCLLRVR